MGYADTALAELAAPAGTMFDPNILRALTAVIASGEIDDFGSSERLSTTVPS